MGSIARNPPNGLANDVLLIAVPFPIPPDAKWLAELEAQHPGLKVRYVVQQPKFPMDPLPEKLYDGVTLLCTLFPAPARRELLQNVRFVQLMSAGADRWISHELYKTPEVTFCTANGVHA
jgi:hypothetical protein